MSIAEDLQQDALELIQEEGQAITIRRVTGSTANADGSITPTTQDYGAYGLFETNARQSSLIRALVTAGADRDVIASREVVWVPALNLAIEPQKGDEVFRASTATGTPQRVESSDAVKPGATAVLYRLELSR